MSERDEMNVARLEAVAAMAKSLAYDLKNGKLWPDELSSGVASIRRELEKVTTR